MSRKLGERSHLFEAIDPQPVSHRPVVAARSRADTKGQPAVVLADVRRADFLLETAE